jgi:LacI family transcriptional regulator
LWVHLPGANHGLNVGGDVPATLRVTSPACAPLRRFSPPDRRGRLEKGFYTVQWPRMTATITDVARRAGVSTATVSRVLNRNYPVSDGVRQRVLDAVRDLGYVANAHARALLTSTSGTVGVILHDVSDPYFAEIVRGIQEVAGLEDRLVVICNSQREPDREITYIEMLRAQRVDAIIMAGGHILDDEYVMALREQALQLRAQGSRLILCGRHPVRADAVVPDNTAGGARLVRHLLDRGHRRIAHIAGPPNFSTTQDRLDGYREGLASFGLAADPDLVATGDFTREGGYGAAGRLLDAGVGFTAIFAANDLAAVGAMARLQERGLRVPEDVSVAGFDDVPVARDVTPALTTVRVPMVDMGRQSMRLALRDPGAPHEVVRLGTELVVRRSVAPPSSGPGPAAARER